MINLNNIPLTQALVQISNLVNDKIEELLPKKQDFNRSRIIEAMRYSSLSDGKKVRPFLVIAAAEIFNVPAYKIMNVAAAIEFIHVYSLIHDDLPAMDDDDYRRGQPSCHKKFDEATAILAGDSLLTYAFQILSDPKTVDNAEIRAELVNVIAKAIGFNGMAGGQMFDLESNGKNLSVDEILKLHHLKTGELFMASIEVGAILGGADLKSKKALINYAYNFGLAFQIKDDILDYLEAESASKKCDETNIVNAIGMELSETKLLQFYNQSLSELATFKDRAKLLKNLADFIIHRKK